MVILEVSQYIICVNGTLKKGQTELWYNKKINCLHTISRSNKYFLVPFMPVINVRATYIGEIIQSETLFTLVTFMASNVREKADE